MAEEILYSDSSSIYNLNIKELILFETKESGCHQTLLYAACNHNNINKAPSDSVA